MIQKEENQSDEKNIDEQQQKQEQKQISSIKNVWHYNAEEEMRKIAHLIEEGYTWVAMDTEFPGIVYNYVIDNNSPEMGYNILKMNVDNLKLIQAGITLAKQNGEKPKPIDTWQFNIKYDLSQEKYQKDSIKLLEQAGINFDNLFRDGIDVMVFGDLLMSSGLVINPNVYWITFHGTYDFSYLYKVLLNSDLPNTSKNFLKHLKHIFPNIYDIKTMINELENKKNHSLSRLAQDLNIARSGIQHQAGSDALLTSEIFFEICKVYFSKGIPNKYYNNIFGISQEGAFANYQGVESIMNNFTMNQYPSYYGQQFYYGHDNHGYQMENFYFQNQQMQGQYYQRYQQGYINPQMQMNKRYQ